ncbi:hyls1 centriolar and ciliogenesis associated [Anticarsia gemmatalis]|uniref:hyls1 centriolar and ciliogenesis associated n=1 Tax=Anticarsia gemmatalis TaxID=129554 RepID=UPI003F7619F9
MDANYYEVTSELDAREVLRYLNNLGIHNISGEVLKYFITDLKKLIKYDLQQKNSSNHEKIEIQGPERLHSASTFSSRIKSKVQDPKVPLLCTRECQKSRKGIPVRNIHSAPNLGQRKVQDKPLRRACSCVRVEKKSESVKENKKAENIANNNLIKVAKQPTTKKCDPVTLYHQYTSLWSKYKSNVPGENDWSDLRWNIRQKMAGNVPRQVASKAPDSHRDKEAAPKS